MYNILLYIIIALASISLAKYLIYLLSTPWYVLKQARYLRASRGMQKKDIEDTLKVSVVVPAWNEEVGIKTSILSLLTNSYDNLEVIVVNDGSTDNTDQVVRDFIKDAYQPGVFGNKTLIYINNQQNGGKGHALNTGIKKSTGDLIITMDADTRFEPDAIYKMARYFIDPTLDAAVGNVKISNNRSTLGIVQQIEYTMGFYFKRTHALFGSEYIIGGAFGAFRRSVFQRFGYYDEINKTEDIELSTRLQYNGCNIMFAEDAIAYTEGPSTLKGLFKQRLRWKKGRFDTLIKYHHLFFSTKKQHRPFLTHFLLPISMLYEIQLVLDPLLAAFGLYYMYHTSNYAAMVSWAILTSFILFIGYIFGSEKNNKKALLLSPLYVFLYFAVNIAEMYAIFGSIKLLLKKQNVAWQNWQRIGVENA